MNIWIFNQYAITPDMPGGTRHFDLGRELVGRGHKVMIIAEALAEAIARLATDPDLRRTLGQRGRERVEEEFSVEAVARRLAEWFVEGRER